MDNDGEGELGDILKQLAQGTPTSVGDGSGVRDTVHSGLSVDTESFAFPDEEVASSGGGKFSFAVIRQEDGDDRCLGRIGTTRFCWLKNCSVGSLGWRPSYTPDENHAILLVAINSSEGLSGGYGQQTRRTFPTSTLVVFIFA